MSPVKTMELLIVHMVIAHISRGIIVVVPRIMRLLILPGPPIRKHLTARIFLQEIQLAIYNLYSYSNNPSSLYPFS
jgi:hypothetical protein